MPRLALLLFLFPFVASAQGVNFEKTLSWSAIQAKAKTENKYIFVDCFTTWCGPCRYMTTTVFPTKEAGDYFNDKFVNVAIQLDTTSKDAPEVKAWYSDAHNIARQYHVYAYPTYLIFSPDGQLVHRIVGARNTARLFITEASDAFDSANRYYTLLDQFQNGRRDSAFLRKLAIKSLMAYDDEHKKTIAEAYLNTQTDLTTKQNLIMVAQTVTGSHDKYFPVLVEHTEELNKINPGWGEMTVRNIYLKEGAGRPAGDNRPPNWAEVHANIATHLPNDADELTARIKVEYYRGRKDWNNFETSMVAYMKTYSAKMNDYELNSLAWAVFENCPDMTCVANILDWSKRLKESSNAAFLDTYANILYKLGKKDDAITLEEKATALVGESEAPQYKATLEKMKNNEKTWN